MWAQYWFSEFTASGSLFDRIMDRSHKIGTSTGLSQCADIQKIIDRVNWGKHFGPQYPQRTCEMPEWDREEYLESIDFDALVDFASSLRDGMPCSIVEETFGHNNLVYDIEFEDSSRWIARIPILPRLYECDELRISETVQRYLLKSMVAAQIFARNIKNVFTPDIYTSFSDGKNPVGVPCMLMQKIDDYRLDEVIGHLPDNDLHTIFSDLAREMVSLASPPYFTQIGSLCQVGDDYEVGPMLAYTSLHDDPVQLDKRGPYDSVEEYFISAVNRHTTAALRDQNRDLYEQAARLRSLLPHIINPQYNNGPFILSPFDWHSRHIFLSQDITLCGIIDWDFATIVPLQSFFRYPAFMTRDWLLEVKSPVMENYRRIFRNALSELQDETEFPLLELLDQSRWFQMFDEGVQSSELGKGALPLLEAYLKDLGNKKVEVKAIPVVRGMPILKDINVGGGKAKNDLSSSEVR